jgi:hypothetical protein
VSKGGISLSTLPPSALVTVTRCNIALNAVCVVWPGCPEPGDGLVVEITWSAIL